MPRNSNLIYLAQVEAELSALDMDRESFINYLLGSLALKVSTKAWLESLALAVSMVRRRP